MMKKLILGIIFILLIVFSQLSAVSADWEAFMKDSGHSLKPDSTPPVYFKTDKSLNLSTSILASPVVSDNILYIGGLNNIFYAIATDDLSIKWTYRTSAPILSTAIISGDFVYVGSNDGKFYSFNRIDGRINFIYDTKSTISSSPSVLNNNVYFTTSLDGKLIALNKITGALIFETPLDQPSQSSPLIFNNNIYVNANDGALYLIDSVDGAIINKFPSTGSPCFISPTSLSNDTILFAPGTLNRNLYAVDSTNMTEKWKYTRGPTGVSPSPLPPSIRITNDSRRRILNLDKLILSSDSERNFSPAKNINYYSAPVDPSLLYNSNGVSTDGTRVFYITGYPETSLVAVNINDQTMAWNHSIGVYPEPAGFYTTPVVVNNYVYFVNSTGDLVVLESATGNEVSSNYVGGITYSIPAFTDGNVYCISQKGYIVKLSQKDDPSLADATPPQIIDFYPEENSTIIFNKPEITVKFHETGSGINYSFMKFRLDGANIPYAFDPVNHKIRFTPYNALSNGLHTVYVQVQDVQGNISNKSWSFTVNYTTDTVKPVISSISPGNNENITETYFPEIIALITESGGSGLDSSNITMKLDDKFVPFILDNNSGTIKYTPRQKINPGTHKIRVTAADKAGNEAIPVEWDFTVTRIEDDTPPVISIISPSESSVYSLTKKPVIQARLTDTETGIYQKGLSLKIDDALVDASFDSNTGILSFKPSTYLSSGVHKVSVFAADNIGNFTSRTWTFTMDFKLQFKHFRISNIDSDSASVNWITGIPSTGKIIFADNREFSNSSEISDSRGNNFISELHDIQLTSLTADKEYYLKISSSSEGETFIHDKIFNFKTFLTDSVSGINVRGVTSFNNSPIENSLVFLTVSSDNNFSFPLSAISDSNGIFTLDAGKLMDRLGNRFIIKNGDKLRISSFGENSIGIFKTYTIDDISQNFDTGDLDLTTTVNYTYNLKPGLNLLSLVLASQSPSSSFEILNSFPSVNEVVSFNTSQQLYETTARLFGLPAGIDINFAETSGYFVKVNTDTSINVTGNFNDKIESIPLVAGLNLSRIPGGFELPDNPYANIDSINVIRSYPDISEISDFDTDKQLFSSSFLLDGSAMGDSFPIRYDKSYFIRSTATKNISLMNEIKYSPQPYFSPAFKISPKRSVSRFAASNRSFRIDASPLVFYGKIMDFGNSVCNDIPISVKLIQGNSSSLPMQLKTDQDGLYYFNIANFNFKEKTKLNMEQARLKILINNKVFTPVFSGDGPVKLENIFFNKGVKQ